MSEPIDGSLNPPPPSGPPDADYLTRDIESALERGVLKWIDVLRQKNGRGRRENAAHVVHLLEALATGEALIMFSSGEALIMFSSSQERQERVRTADGRRGRFLRYFGPDKVTVQWDDGTTSEVHADALMPDNTTRD